MVDLISAGRGLAQHCKLLEFDGGAPTRALVASGPIRLLPAERVRDQIRGGFASVLWLFKN